MSFAQIAAVAALLGIGGAIGAIIAMMTAATRVESDFSGFRELFRSYISNKSDGPSLALRDSFEAFELDLASLSETFEKVKAALKIKR